MGRTRRTWLAMVIISEGSLLVSWLFFFFFFLRFIWLSFREWTCSEKTTLRFGGTSHAAPKGCESHARNNFLCLGLRSRWLRDFTVSVLFSSVWRLIAIRKLYCPGFVRAHGLWGILFVLQNRDQASQKWDTQEIVFYRSI